MLCETVKTFLVNVGEIYRQSDESYADDDVAFKVGTFYHILSMTGNLHTQLLEILCWNSSNL